MTWHSWKGIHGKVFFSPYIYIQTNINFGKLQSILMKYNNGLLNDYVWQYRRCIFLFFFFFVCANVCFFSSYFWCCFLCKWYFSAIRNSPKRKWYLDGVFLFIIESKFDFYGCVFLSIFPLARWIASIDCFDSHGVSQWIFKLPVTVHSATFRSSILSILSTFHPISIVVHQLPQTNWN